MIGAQKVRVLFLCTGNSCRSQMAEGLARARQGNLIEPYSAGTLAKGLDARAAQVMAEIGVDIGGQRSKTLNDVKHLPFDWVVTLCGAAHESCPVFPARTRVRHVGFDDPPELAREARTEQEALMCYRRVRDEIAAFVERLPEVLSDG